MLAILVAAIKAHRPTSWSVMLAGQTAASDPEVASVGTVERQLGWQNSPTLSENESKSRPEISHSATGTVPSRLLALSRRKVTAESEPSSEGIVPVKELACRLSVAIPTRLPIEVGTGPMKSLLSRLKVVTPTIVSISVGILPPSLLLSKLNFTISDRQPIAAGSVPTKQPSHQHQIHGAMQKLIQLWKLTIPKLTTHSQRENI